MILSGSEGWVSLKAVVTPVKLVLFIAGVVIGLIALVQLIRRGRPASSAAGIQR